MNHRSNEILAPRVTGSGLAQTSRRPGHALADLLPVLLLAAQGLLTSIDARAAGDTTRVSVNSWGKQANNEQYNATISADGRYVAFQSYADNLVPGDTNGVVDVFVRDLRTGHTSRVSVDSAGSQGNGDSYTPAISADGRYVAFESSADNLVSGDTSGRANIFVHDRQTRQTTCVSVSSAGSPSSAWLPTISANGRYVAFESAADNLVSSDTNGTIDVFVHDRQTHQTMRVNVASNGEQVMEVAASLEPSISANGRYVAFSSAANNHVPGDTNSVTDVFVHDVRTGHTSRVSVDSAGSQGNWYSYAPAISADGRYVAFLSEANNLVPGDNFDSDVFVHDRLTHETTRANVASDGEPANGRSDYFSISADGRYVAFQSWANNLAPGGSGWSDIFVRDRWAGQTTLVSMASDGEPPNDTSYDKVTISADGRYVAFSSYADNLVPGDTNGVVDVFVRDRLLDRSATADLAVTQTASPAPFPPSSPITYTINVVNNGPDAAGEVTLVDGPLRGTAVPSQGHCSTSAPVICYLGNLAAHASATVTLTLPRRSIGTSRVYNAARVNAAPVDPDPANNKSGLHVSVAR
ncbi:hypothetical protein ACW73L_19535 [Methylolobus aquaticus]